MEELSQEQILTRSCDLLVPAASETQITSKFAKDIKSKAILELANGSTTDLADKILSSKGVYVLPDILSNTGGVTVSYFEWLQNKAGETWELNQVDEKLKKRMVNSYENVLEVAKDHKAGLKDASYILAISRMVQVISDRGIFP